MAIGFTPKYNIDFPLNELTPEHFLVLANETAKKLQWKIGYISKYGLIAYTDNGLFSRNSEIKIKIEDGFARIISASSGSEMVDWGSNKKLLNDFTESFTEIKSSISPEDLENKYQELAADFPSDQEDELQLPPATTTDKIKDFFSIFIPVKGFTITPLLLDVNILLFILMALSGVNILLPDNDSLLTWGANFKPLTLEGEWWRLLTNCFLHIGIIHLLMNMYALLYIGVLLEPILGKTRFISAYLLTGITASITSLWWHDLTISAGASGAIFGMYGVFLALLTTNYIEKNARKTLLTSIAVFVGYNLLNGMRGGIDNAAHIGGLLCGIGIGYAFIPGLNKEGDVRIKYATIGILTFLVISGSAAVYKNLPNDIGEYDKKMTTFASMESMALEVYNLPENTSEEDILYALNDRGIYYWNENIKLLESFEKLNLPIEIRSRNRILKEYCELRIESYELSYDAIKEDTDEYNAEIEEYNKKISEKLKELETLIQNQ